MKRSVCAMATVHVGHPSWSALGNLVPPLFRSDSRLCHKQIVHQDSRNAAGDAYSPAHAHPRWPPRSRRQLRSTWPSSAASFLACSAAWFPRHQPRHHSRWRTGRTWTARVRNLCVPSRSRSIIRRSSRSWRGCVKQKCSHSGR